MESVDCGWSGWRESKSETGRERDVLAVLNALRQRKLDFSLVVIQACHSPRAVCVKPVLVDLEPLQTRDCGRQRAVYFGEVDHDRSQVAWVNGIGLVRRRCRVERVVPFCSESVAGFDVDDVLWERLV